MSAGEFRDILEKIAELVGCETPFDSGALENAVVDAIVTRRFVEFEVLPVVGDALSGLLHSIDGMYVEFVDREEKVRSSEQFARQALAHMSAAVSAGDVRARHRNITWQQEGDNLPDVLVIDPERNALLHQFIGDLIEKDASLRDIVTALNDRGDLTDNEWTAVMYLLGVWNAQNGGARP